MTIKFFFQIIITYFVLIIFFIGSLILVSSIPTFLIKKNIHLSIQELKKEGIYPSIGWPWRKIVVDNFTNALMLNIAYSIDSQKPFQSALNNYFYNNKINKNDQILNLEKLYQKIDITPVNYSRYWHGYLLYLRPLLVFFSFKQIKIILTTILYLFFFSFVFLIGKKIGKKTAFSFLLGFLAVDFLFIGQSPSFFSPFLIGLLGGIYLLNKKEIKNPYIIFFISGGLTSFFDLLSSPLVSLGIIILIMVNLRKVFYKEIFLMVGFWFLGYLSLWLGKWIVSDLLFFNGAIKGAINQIFYRTIAVPDSNFSYGQTLMLNFFQLIGYDKTNKIIVFLLGIVSFLYLVKKFSFKKSHQFKSFIPLILISLIPYFWFLVVANHSYIHVWFTYRNQLMTVIALILIYFRLI